VIAKTPAVRRRRQAFSLVEMVLAIGIVSVVFIPLMGLLPVGLASFRSSMDTAIVSQIVQQIGSDALQSDFDAIPLLTGTRFFDDQAREVPAAEKTRSLYQTRVVTVEGPDAPHLKRLIFQVVRNPGGVVQMEVGADTGQWEENGSLPVVTRSLLIARSSAMPRN
jgi:uncharacterized protein (TIGR02598 family)